MLSSKKAVIRVPFTANLEPQYPVRRGTPVSPDRGVSHHPSDEVEAIVPDSDPTTMILG